MNWYMSWREERTACEAAFLAAFGSDPEAWKGKWAWCCHHQMEMEELTEHWSKRIAYIATQKPANQRAVRFANFRPVLSKATALALAEYERVRAAAWAEYERMTAAARAECERVTALALVECDHVRAAAWVEYARMTAAAWAEYERVTALALAEYRRVRAAAWAECERVTALALAEYRRVTAAAWVECAHRADVPNHTWNGTSIFA